MAGWRRRIQSTSATGRSGNPARTNGSISPLCPRPSPGASRPFGPPAVSAGPGAAGHAGALAPAQELRGHLAAGLVDHLVADHDRALARAGRGRSVLGAG